MELLLCINAKRYTYPHNLNEGSVYKLLDTLRCEVCGFAFVKIEGGVITPPPHLTKFRCHKCRSRLPPQVAGFFRRERFIPINNPNLKLEEEKEKELDLTER